MPCCTYLDDHIVGSWRAGLDKELNELLDEAHRVSDKRWAIEPRQVWVGPWWRRKEKTFYTLYGHVSFNEWQVINFPLRDSGTSINLLVDRSYVITYLYGFIGGVGKPVLKYLG